MLITTAVALILLIILFENIHDYRDTLLLKYIVQIKLWFILNVYLMIPTTSDAYIYLALTVQSKTLPIGVSIVRPFDSLVIGFSYEYFTRYSYSPVTTETYSKYSLVKIRYLKEMFSDA